MRKNGRHANPKGWTRPKAARADGFRPLSLAVCRALNSDSYRRPSPRPDAASGAPDPGASSSAAPPTPAAPTPTAPTPTAAAPPTPASAPAPAPARGADHAEPERTPEQAEARARELAEWMADRERHLAGGGGDPSGRWRSIQAPPPPDARAAGFASPGAERSDPQLREFMRTTYQQFERSLVERWGGRDALDRLDVAPLPDEAFDWSTVPTEHHDKVRQILALVDDTCAVWFDQEHRTACRRLLARVAGEPWVIGRRGKVETIAGAIVWTIAAFNRTTGRRRRGVVPAIRIAEHLGLSSGSAFEKRSIDICVAAGIHLHNGGPEPVAEPGLCVSRRRRHAARLRDKYRAELG